MQHRMELRRISQRWNNYDSRLAWLRVRQTIVMSILAATVLFAPACKQTSQRSEAAQATGTPKAVYRSLYTWPENHKIEFFTKNQILYWFTTDCGSPLHTPEGGIYEDLPDRVRLHVRSPLAPIWFKNRLFEYEALMTPDGLYDWEHGEISPNDVLINVTHGALSSQRNLARYVISRQPVAISIMHDGVTTQPLAALLNTASISSATLESVCEVNAAYSSSFRDDNLSRACSLLPNIEKLNLWRSGVSGKGLASIAVLGSLKQLDIRGVRCEEKDLRFLSALRHLEELSIADCGSTITLSEAGNLDALKRLKISSCYDGIRLFENLARMPQIEELHVTKGQVTSKALEFLAPLSKLNRLSLADTGIGDKELTQLASMKSLQELNLRGSAITTSGLAALSQLPSLRILVLPAQADDAWIDGIAQLRQLRVLYFSMARKHQYHPTTRFGTPSPPFQANRYLISDKALEQLRVALPGCDIRLR